MLLNSMFAKGVAGLLVGLVVSLAPMRDADAAMFVGTFDPAFGPAFPSLGFRGTATFNVPETCLAQDGFCSDAGISMVSAAVTLYDLNNTDNSVQLGFDPASLDNVFIQGGTLFGVNSAILGPQQTFSDGFFYTGSIFLQFALTSGDGFLGMPSAFIYACDPANNQCTADEAIQSNPARLSFVPEPGSAALLLVALGAAAMARRRRAR